MAPVANRIRMNRPGQRDYGSIRLSRHALERFVERFGAAPDSAEEILRGVLARTRRLGRNQENGAIAILALYEARVLVAIVQGDVCLTVLTWNQFAPRLSEFGRSRIPRKWGRLLRRLSTEKSSADAAADDEGPTSATSSPEIPG